MNIPIYRAKRKDNGEYIEGFLCDKNLSGTYSISLHHTEYMHPIKYFPIYEETLAISFDGMTDKNGNRVFAALNESGIGSDYELINGVEWVWRYSRGFIYSSRLDDYETTTPFFEIETKNIEIAGIYGENTK